MTNSVEIIQLKFLITFYTYKKYDDLFIQNIITIIKLDAEIF